MTGVKDTDPIREAVAAYRKYGTLRRAAAVLGVSHQTVSNRLRKAGEPALRDRPESQAKRAQVVQLWDRGLGTLEIAQAVGRGRPYVWKVLRRSGRRSRTSRPRIGEPVVRAWLLVPSVLWSVLRHQAQEAGSMAAAVRQAVEEGLAHEDPDGRRSMVSKYAAGRSAATLRLRMPLRVVQTLRADAGPRGLSRKIRELIVLGLDRMGVLSQATSDNRSSG